VRRLTASLVHVLLGVVLLYAVARFGLKIFYFLRSPWSRDYGVRHKAQTVTIRSTVDDLIVDYAHHSEQIRGLTKNRS